MKRREMFKSMGTLLALPSIAAATTEPPPAKAKLKLTGLVPGSDIMVLDMDENDATVAHVKDSGPEFECLYTKGRRLCVIVFHLEYNFIRYEPILPEEGTIVIPVQQVRDLLYTALEP